MRKSNLINVVVCEGKTNVFDVSIINCANIIDKRSVHCPRPNIKSEVVIGDVVHWRMKVEQIVAGVELSAFIMKEMRIFFAITMIEQKQYSLIENINQGNKFFFSPLPTTEKAFSRYPNISLETTFSGWVPK